jgi:hypothetical protein
MKNFPSIFISIISTIIFSFLSSALFAQILVGQPKQTADGKLVFYHWGSEPHMSQMIEEKVYTNERFQFFNDEIKKDKLAAGPGFYMADNLITSSSYAKQIKGIFGRGNKAYYPGGLVEVHLDPKQAKYRTYQTSAADSMDSKEIGWYITNSQQGISFHPLTKSLLSEEEIKEIFKFIAKNQNEQALKAFSKYFPDFKSEDFMTCGNCICFF